MRKKREVGIWALKARLEANATSRRVMQLTDQDETRVGSLVNITALPHGSSERQQVCANNNRCARTHQEAFLNTKSWPDFAV